MRINLIVIRTNQPKKLVEFYNRFNLNFEYHRHGKGDWHYSADIDNIVFEIYPLMKDQAFADKSLRIGFEVEKLDKLILELKKAGVEIVSFPKKSDWGYISIIKDVDGRKIELKEK